MALDDDESLPASLTAEPRSQTEPVHAPSNDAGDADESNDDTDWQVLNVWKTIDVLKSEGIASKSTDARAQYAETTAQVVSILETLGHTYVDHIAWKSVLNKASLKHEVEESIVALHHLGNWITSTRGQGNSSRSDLTVVDMCCGKGFFSMLLSFMVGTFWQDFGISTIVLLDKATAINWKYIEVANETAEAEHRPLMTLWKGVNLHDYDILLDRLLGLSQKSTTTGTPTKLALVGIHLCKNLSPAAVSLKNGLGEELCPYMLLAPCCLPRTVTSKYMSPTERNVRVYQYETPAERSKRLTTTDQRDLAFGKGQKIFCYLCSTEGEHRVKNCPTLDGTTADERKDILVAAALLLPCWKCGEVGHQKANCPSPERPAKQEPPSAYYNVASILSASQPFAQYCQVLGTALGMQDGEGTNSEGISAPAGTSVIIHETGLNNNANGHEEEPSQEGNWNKSRKSIYIVATTMAAA